MIIIKKNKIKLLFPIYFISYTIIRNDRINFRKMIIKNIHLIYKYVLNDNYLQFRDNLINIILDYSIGHLEYWKTVYNSILQDIKLCEDGCVETAKFLYLSDDSGDYDVIRTCNCKCYHE